MGLLNKISTQDIPQLATLGIRLTPQEKAKLLGPKAPIKLLCDNLPTIQKMEGKGWNITVNHSRKHLIFGSLLNPYTGYKRLRNEAKETPEAEPSFKLEGSLHFTCVRTRKGTELDEQSRKKIREAAEILGDMKDGEEFAWACGEFRMVMSVVC